MDIWSGNELFSSIVADYISEKHAYENKGHLYILKLAD
jgi:hypothetical protein